MNQSKLAGFGAREAEEPPQQFTVVGIGGLGEIAAGDDLLMLVGNAIEDEISTGDILVVTSKIVSKAEGRSLKADSREDAITAETVRLVASKPHPGGVTRIVQNKLGLVLAAAGVDASNTPDGTVLLLPEDPDASARALCIGLRQRFGFDLGVIITDTLGRPWRLGQTDLAIGAAGMAVTHDLRGTRDDFDRPMDVTITAVADEIAGAANLVLGKTSRRPVAVVHGMDHLVRPLEEPGARTLIRPVEDDLFRLGSAEARLEGFHEGFAAGQRSTVESAVIAEGSAPA
ncbi:coenzyme F420-0:L-glutamate ligase/coenzyme F420-1:gamma-L-glutamate ligase [Arthrobacter ginsengisoli]|uniref:Coenzyme F420-0:L-glutamate ligase/coenzyme F420-1:gamma-L-glutamate ligase n=1 Tax=Arthrobacter ginsengisoli TaxID=1356565 RepID=A0ABU1UIA8_9MICC|nr:coenzyme F420-0:L-glutamate ligase [Arthrobacter ginsengisoli]MDR7084919.1 coenzyme F420-0:L-glutamate ligase/coenzyme F420-1:gamma-L-glutamate ligase [Arthrobacter ginsengisoli]